MNTEKTIREIMTTELVTIKENATLEKVLAIFRASNFHHVLVMGKDGKLSGIISKEDLLKVSYSTSLNTGGKIFTQKWYDSMTAKDIMTPTPITVDPDDNIGLAADIFYANRFRALPVVEIDELLGIITPYDLLKYAFSNIQAIDPADEESRVMRQ